jgi:hypothetical protein
MTMDHECFKGEPEPDEDSPDDAADAGGEDN